MPHILVSYRRADSDAMAGRIRDRIASHFGENSVFMDIDSIPFGIDFREHIKEALARNNIVIAVVGPKWLGPGKGGHLRITEENDPVRIEIETALKRGSAVIPVLVGSTKMPKPSDLPDSLKAFAYRNAAQVDMGRDFHPHMERLLRSMDSLLARTKWAEAGSGEPDQAAASAGVAGSTVVQTPAEPAGPAPHQAPHDAGIAKAELVEAIPATPSRGPTPVEKQGGGRLKVWLAVSSACMVLGIGIGAWLYLMNKDKPVAPSIASPSTVPPSNETRSLVRPASVTSVECKLEAPAVFADDFHIVDPAWPVAAESYVDGQLALNGLAGKYVLALYPPLRFKNAAICAKLKNPQQIGSLDGGAKGGVVFWAENVSNFYLAALFANDTYSIWRRIDGSWAQVSPRTPSEFIKSGAGAINEIGVTTRSGTAALSINGAKVHDFHGQPPKESSMIGLYGASNSDERNEWRVLNVAVADLDQPKRPETAKAPAPQVGPGCKPLRAAAFRDNFESADPGWGVGGNQNAYFADHELALKPAVERSWRQLYPSLIFQNATVCAHVRSPLQIPQNSITNGGLAFWAASTSNYYVAHVYPDGRFSVRRWINPEWATLIPPTKSEAVKAGVGATNEVMVAFNGNLAVLHLNGQKVAEFRGQPPQKGGSIGVFASTDKAGQSEWRFLDVVVVENE